MPRTKNKITSEFLIYLLCFFVVSYTFQNFFHSNTFKAVIILTGGLMYFSYIGRLTVPVFLVMFAISVIIAIQGLFFGYNPLSHVTSLFFNVFLVYVLLSVMPFNYHKYLINLIFVLSLISFGLWILCNFSSGVHEAIPEIAQRFGLDRVSGDNLRTGAEQILVFTYEKARIFGILRNAGFCHEPGGYAVVLIYAIIFNTLHTRKFFGGRNLFFILCLLSTFSTAGYASLYIVLLNNYLARRRHIVGQAIGVMFGLVISFYSFSTLDFMSSKIADQYNAQAQADLNEGTDGRILGARKALVVLSRYPFTGRGFLTVSQTGDANSDESAGYGFMTFASQVGIPLAILTFMFLFRTLHFWTRAAGLKKQQAVLFFIAFIPVLFSQTFIPSILFNMIIFEYLFRNYKAFRFKEKELSPGNTPAYA